METADENTACNFYIPLKIIDRLFLLSFFFFDFFTAQSQTSNISGIVNSYYKVVEIIPAKAAIRVSNISGLNMNDKVMIIQMKGASVSTANNNSFGDTTSLNNAGNYEIGTICSIHGDTAYMFFNLANQYTVSDKVQLVKFAEYYSANVIDTVKAASWDSSAGTGGVIAISVTTDLTLNAPIFADSKGYKGGSILQCSSTFCVTANGYAYNPTITSFQQYGAWKGEGIASIATSISGGRGALANGGGGGNFHNNGGGGGANLTKGGDGGGNSSLIGCLSSYVGIAGKPLSSSSGKKIFLGGGGGAGHYNSITPTGGGGNGGGIIFITANNLIGNGYKISANGQTGGSTSSDGASGGGAGGTIIMDILNSYSGSLIIQTNGGTGGTSNDGGNVNRCYGAGGGGSGGVIYFTGSSYGTINTNGGNAGPEVSSDASCTVILPSAGTNGSTISDYSYIRSLVPAGYCSTLLPVTLLYFKATAAQGKAWLQWKIASSDLISHFVIERLGNVNGWKNIGSVNANNNLSVYDFIDNNPTTGINQYRIKIVETNGKTYYSPIQKISIDVNSEFDIYPNPSSGIINIAGDFSSLTTIQLFDLAGKMIWEKEIFSNNNIARLQLPLLTQGIYTMRINNSIKKLVIR